MELIKIDLNKVKLRIKKEREFLESRDKDKFDMFIEAWRDEMKSNEELVYHFKEVLKYNNRIVQDFERAIPWEMLVVAGISSPAYPKIAQRVFGFGPLTPSQDVIVHTLSLLMIIVGTIMAFKTTFRNELIEIYYMEKIFGDLEEIGAIKKPWWKFW